MPVISGHTEARQIPQLSDSSYASVLTIQPGAPLYSAFGHTAIRIRDDSLDIDVVYNYGTFDFETEGFYLKFMRGLLDYRLARNRFEDVLTFYAREGRPVIEQRLNLTEGQRQLLILKLEDNYLPANRYYRYDFFFDNCSTRPRDVIESVFGAPQFLGDSTGDGRTFRELIETYTAPRPWIDLGIDLVLGSGTDQEATSAEALFLPDELFYALDRAYIGGEPVVSRLDTLFWPTSQTTQRTVAWFGPTTVFWLLFLALLVVSFTGFSEQRIVAYLDAILFGLLGFAGIVILALWFATEHTVTTHNWNILLAFPAHLIAAALAIRTTQGGDFARAYFGLSALLAASLLASWTVLGQDFHQAVIPLSLMVILRGGMKARKSMYDV